MWSCMVTFFLKQACITDVKTLHGTWSFSSIFFQTHYVLTSSHMISRHWVYCFHAAQTHHILKTSKPPFTGFEAALLLTNRLCSGCITAWQSPITTTPLTENPFCASSSNHTHRPLTTFSMKVSWQLTKETVTLEAALALMLSTILSSYPVVKWVLTLWTHCRNFHSSAQLSYHV